MAGTKSEQRFVKCRQLVDKRYMGKMCCTAAKVTAVNGAFSGGYVLTLTSALKIYCAVAAAPWAEVSATGLGAF